MRPIHAMRWLSFLAIILTFCLPGTVAVGKSPLQRATSYKQAAQQIVTQLKTPLETASTHVVWLLDEGPSMRDDSEELSKLIEDIQNGSQPAGNEFTLSHSVASFGKSTHLSTKRPTSNLDEVRHAIAKVPMDETGQENIYQAVGSIASQFGRVAVKTKQKLVIVVLTDESGSDGQHLEQCIAVCKRSAVQVHILGRAAMFGSGKAYYIWKHPVSNLNHWLQTDRGPASIFQETITYQGVGRAVPVADAFSPYGQTRLVAETNGVFIALPDGTKSPKYDPALMSQYSPSLQSLQEYIKQTKSSPLRAGITQVVSTVNQAARHSIDQVYSFDAGERNLQHTQNAERVQFSLLVLDKAITALEKLRPLRAKEKNARWQANFDLSYAQCSAARLRLIHTLVQLSRLDSMKPTKEKSNRWSLSTTPKIAPLESGEAALVAKTLGWKIKPNSVDLALEQLAKETKSTFEYVKKEHPDTPWARQAAGALRRGFGVRILETMHLLQPKIVIKPPVL